jgi:hypothetical protein
MEVAIVADSASRNGLRNGTGEPTYQNPLCTKAIIDRESTLVHEEMYADQYFQRKHIPLIAPVGEKCYRRSASQLAYSSHCVTIPWTLESTY